MIAKLYKLRFEIFLITQLMILFGSLLFPPEFYEHILLPLFYLISIVAGVLLISKKKKLMWLFVGLFVISAFVFGFEIISRKQNTDNMLIRLFIYFVFYITVTWNIIKQVWQAQHVTKNVIMGLMSGYVSLGFLAFFLFMSIELMNPGAFSGILIETNDIVLKSEGILYYAYITLLTIGYGEIVPTIPIAQKAAVLVGLMGQFYMVIITAVVVEKYIKHSSK